MQFYKNSRKVKRWCAFTFCQRLTALFLSLCLASLPTAQVYAVPAVASFTDIAALSATPHLASITPGQQTLLNALLGNLLGNTLNLTIVDWQSLAQGEIGVDRLIEQIQSDSGALTPESVLTTTITLEDFLTAAINVTQTEGDLGSVSALTAIRDAVSGVTGQIQLGDLLQFDPNQIGLPAIDLNLLDLTTGAIQLFNQEHVVTTPMPITITGNALGLTGILNQISLQAQVVEPPVYTIGGINTQFYTADIRLKLSLDLVDSKPNLSGLINTLENLLGVLSNVEVDATIGQLDLYVTITRGQGTLTLLNALAQALTIQAQPGIVDLYVGAMNDVDFFNRTRPISPTTDLQFGTIGAVAITVTNALVTLADVDINLQARSSAEGTNPITQTLNFVAPYPQTQTATTSSDVITTLVNELVSNLQLQLSGDLGTLLNPLLNSTILPALQNVVDEQATSLLPTIFTEVMDPLLADLGLGVGEIDVTVTAVTRLNDTDGDGLLDPVDSDDDGDGIRDVNEGQGVTDTDGDTMPDTVDTDSDNDGIPDATEAHDANHDGLPDRTPTGQDTDHDGLDNAFDPDQGGTPAPLPNTDGDAQPDFQDANDDNDSLNTIQEHNGTPIDTDDDGRPDYLDPANTNPCVPNANAQACTGDTDNDGTPNGNDPAPTDPCIPNANALACPTGDTDNDGTPNGNDPAPTDPCIPNANALACPTGDTDNDGPSNNTDPAPTNPCIPNANALACPTGDTDNDGFLNNVDPAPLDPCIPNANALACLLTKGIEEGLYLPLIRR